MSAIPHQIKLPPSVAFEVVLQGIKIRLGRSVVTMMGIVLGVAFLMSILSANLIRQGVAGETAARQETQRMLGFLTAETGPLSGRTIAVLQHSPLHEQEQRLLRAIQAERPARINWLSTLEAPPGWLRLATPAADPEEAGHDASGILFIGDQPRVEELRLALAGARQRVIATVRPEAAAAPSEFPVVSLARELRQEELIRLEQEEQRNRARSIWIITIALLVTIICISNSLLMSVTERFREIGTMKCLGALSSFIRRIYFIESSLLGLIGSLIGAITGLIFAIVMYGITYGFGIVMAALSPAGVAFIFFVCVIGGIIAAIVAAIYPASFASRMVEE